MTLLSDYTAGTVSSSGNVITGTGTAWQTAGYGEGDEFSAPGWSVKVASVDSETQLTVDPTRGVVGPALSGAEYGLRRSAANAKASEQARQLIDMLSGTGTLEGLAGLTTAANKMPYFTGPGGAAALADLTAFGRALAALTGANGSIPVATGAGTAAMRAIVGTVSHVGGIPTGALMEQGNNANGWYWRFANRMQICARQVTVADSGYVAASWAASFFDTSYFCAGVSASSSSAALFMPKMHTKSTSGAMFAGITAAQAFGNGVFDFFAVGRGI